jgi:hypothetical protein
MLHPGRGYKRLGTLDEIARRCRHLAHWLELDGNNQLVSRSRQPDYSIQGPCTHFGPQELGDLFFDLTKLGPLSGTQ